MQPAVARTPPGGRYSIPILNETLMIPGIRNTVAGLVIGHGRPLNIRTGDVAATGNSQATAALLTYPSNNVTAGDGTKAVRLPAPQPGQLVLVYHSVATVGLPVYPHSGGAINGGSANAAVTIEGKTAALFFATATGNWAAIFTANT